MGLGTPAKDFVSSILAVVVPAFTLPVLKSILYDGSSSIKMENIVRLVLFLLFTPTIILAQLMLMAWVKPTIHAIELGAFLMENTVADNFMMMIAFLVNTVLLVPSKMLFFKDNNTDSGKAIYEDIHKEIYEVSEDSGIDSSEFSDSETSEITERQQHPTRHSVRKGKVIISFNHQQEQEEQEEEEQEEEEREEFAEPHDAWVHETGKGAYRPDFKEEGETFYLVFWYWVCNNILS